MMRKTFITALYFIAAVAAVAQDVKTTPQPKPTLKEITVESIFDPKARVGFPGPAQSGLVWLDDKAFVWRRTNEPQRGLITSIVTGALITGAISFVIGFFGPILFATDLNQGPLLGLFITGPLGFILGAIGGAIYWIAWGRHAPQRNE